MGAETMRTYYEWDVEEVDSDGDVSDHDFDEKLSVLLKAHPIGENESLVLVYNLGSELDGIQDRAWAYVKEGELPEEFDNGYRVPMRFHHELSRVAS